LLAAELAVLVEARRKLLLEKLKKKMKLRRHRLRIKMAIKIQKVVRSFLARQAVKRLNAAAIQIQRVWRGHIVRFRLKRVFDDMDELIGLDLPNSHRRTKKIIKIREDSDGKEQEYYDYDEYSDDEGNSSIEGVAPEQIADDQRAPEQVGTENETVEAE
jgi:hypothetical protein